MPLIAAAAIGGITAGIKGYQGYKQKKAGEKALKSLVEPTYQIPEEISQELSDAERMEVEGLSGQQKKEFVENIERSRTAALRSQADRKGGLLGIQGSMAAEADAYSNLVSMDAAARAESEMRKQQRLSQARRAMAGAKEKKLAFQEGRYQEKLTSAQAQIGAGEQNIMGAIDTLGATGINLLTAGAGGAA
jgi:hypothetical protein